jgi:hypothetical protein
MFVKGTYLLSDNNKSRMLRDDGVDKSESVVSNVISDSHQTWIHKAEI